MDSKTAQLDAEVLTSTFGRSSVLSIQNLPGIPTRGKKQAARGKVESR